ncbi:hypothetical protein JCM15579A_30160 [Marinifilum fragile]
MDKCVKIEAKTYSYDLQVVLNPDEKIDKMTKNEGKCILF